MDGDQFHFPKPKVRFARMPDLLVSNDKEETRWIRQDYDRLEISQLCQFPCHLNVSGFEFLPGRLLLAGCAQCGLENNVVRPELRANIATGQPRDEKPIFRNDYASLNQTPIARQAPLIFTPHRNCYPRKYVHFPNVICDTQEHCHPAFIIGLFSDQLQTDRIEDLRFLYSQPGAVGLRPSEKWAIDQIVGLS
jgi:hypothetical protein